MRSMLFKEISRRRFLAQGSALAAASMLHVELARAEPPPEITRLRIAHGVFICYAPQMLAEEMLRSEGFTQIEYVDLPPTVTYAGMVAKGFADLAMFGPPAAVAGLDAGWPLTVIGGIHVGCWELFARRELRTVSDLKGKTIAVIGMGAVDQLWLGSILSYVGVDPTRDVHWLVAGKAATTMRRFVEGQADAFLGFPPQPQELRARGIDHVLVNTTEDRPWSQYFCCMAAMPRDFIARYPVATKRVLRALLKASDMCTAQPEAAAQYLVRKGYEPRYDIALEVLKTLPYDGWRELNPEDSLRFHGLRLHDAGMLRANPNDLIARGTDWTFLNQLKRELKA